jgi:hypothetical protein
MALPFLLQAYSELLAIQNLLKIPKIADMILMMKGPAGGAQR